MSIPDSLMETYFDLATGIPVNHPQYAELSAMKKQYPAMIKADMLRQRIRSLKSRTADKPGSEIAKLKQELDMVSDMYCANYNPRDDKIFLAKKEEYAVGTAEIEPVSLLAEAGLVKSKGEARRLIKQGAVKLDDKTINAGQVIRPSDGSVLKVGKRRFLKLRVVD